jgi:hypothetical protein
MKMPSLSREQRLFAVNVFIIGAIGTVSILVALWLVCAIVLGTRDLAGRIG